MISKGDKIREDLLNFLASLSSEERYNYLKELVPELKYLVVNGKRKVHRKKSTKAKK